MSTSKILLTPGPCMTSDAVRHAGAGHDLNHRDPAFLDVMRETKRRLLEIYPDTDSGWHPFLIGGSGTLAVEAMITSLIETGPALILENGYYSSRIREIFEIHKIPFLAINHNWLSAWDFEAVESELEKGYEAVIGVHNETTTGRLNDIGRLGSLCKAKGTKCLIDAMSSFGADPIDFSGIDAVCASGNKCLHSIPGVGFVLVKEDLVAAMSKVPRRSYYMSLPLYLGESPPLTPPVPALEALCRALQEYPSGGVAERHSLYMERAGYLRSQLSDLGFRPAIPFEECSCTLSTVTLPKDLKFDQWFDLNFQKGFVIYACKGRLREEFFQVSNMGEITMPQLQSWVGAVAEILSQFR